MVSSVVDTPVRIALLLLIMGAVALVHTIEPEPTGFVVSVDPNLIETLEDEEEVRVIITYRESARDRGMRIMNERLPEPFTSRMRPRMVNGKELENLRKDPDIESIIEDVRVSHALSTSREIINASAAWDLSFEGVNLSGSGSTVCVIDTGIDYTHESLGGCTTQQFLAGDCTKVLAGYDFVNDDDDPWDDNGHGTHVSGIIAANGSVVGVAPGAGLIAIKSLDHAGDGWIADALLGVEWCTTHKDTYNITAISMSLGSSQRFMSTCDGWVPSWTAIIDAAVEANISVVSATGNSGSNSSIAFPACVNSSMRVGATTSSDAIASFTNRGSGFPDLLLAPGVLISSTVPGGTGSSSGTSMATPHVSGALALLDEFAGWQNRTVTPREALDAFMATGLPVHDSASNTTYRRIDAYGLVLSFDGFSPNITFTYDPNPEPGSNWTLTWSITTIGEIDTTLVTVTTPNETIERDEAAGNLTIENITAGAHTISAYANTTTSTEANRSEPFFVRYEPIFTFTIEDNASNYSSIGATNATVSANLTDGEVIELFIQDSFVNASNTTINHTEAFSEPGEYSVRVRHNATDVYALAEREYYVMIIDPAPELVSRTPQDAQVSILENETITFSVEANDPYEEGLNYTWVLNESEAGNLSNLTFDGMNLTPALYPVRVDIENRDSSVSEHWNLTVTAVAPLVETDPESGALELEHNETRVFSANATDLKNRSVTYSWVLDGEVSNTSEAELNATALESGTLVLTVSNGYAQTIIEWELTILLEPVPLSFTSDITSLSWNQGSSGSITLIDYFSTVEGVVFTLETAMPLSMTVSNGVATLSASDSYSGSGTARIQAEHDGENATSNEFAVTINAVSSGGGGGGGGGGGSSGGSIGGTSLPPPEPEPEPVETVRVESVGAFERIEARLASPAHEPRVTVRELSQNPPGIAPFRGRAYAMSEITVDESVEEVVFSFTVPLAWIETEGVAPETIGLYRFTTEWESLDTEFRGLSDGAYKYRAIAPGLSVFVIGVAEERIGVVVDMPLVDLSIRDEPETIDEEPVSFVLIVSALALIMLVILTGRKYTVFSS